MRNRSEAASETVGRARRVVALAETDTRENPTIFMVHPSNGPEVHWQPEFSWKQAAREYARPTG